MRFPFSRPRHDAQVWPCGTDCIYARPVPTRDGDWIWCDRPAASSRLRHAGLECVEFRSTGAHQSPAIDEAPRSRPPFSPPT